MDPSKYPKRKQIRLPDYDYQQEGGYFVTICTFQKILLFGHIDDGEVHLTPYGQIAMTCWQSIPNHIDSVQLDEFVIMPNHMHGILFFKTSNKSLLGYVIATYKSAVTRQIHEIEPESRIWQRNYYEHILRDEEDYIRISTYIITNPARWREDKLYV